MAAVSEMGAKAAVGMSLVKSVARTLQTLELFDDLRKPANVVEVAKRLGFPRSSASALLKSMVALGYLTYDSRKRTYFPTDRVALSGSWLKPALYGNGELLKLLKAVMERSGEVVLLGARIGNMSQLIHIARPEDSAGYDVTLGAQHPLYSTAIGQMLLSTVGDDDVQKLLRRFNAYRAAGSPPINTGDMLSVVRECRRNGYAFSVEPAQGDAGEQAMISILLPLACTETPLAMSIAGSRKMIEARHDELIRIMRVEILNFFGDVGMMSLYRGPHTDMIYSGEPRLLRAAGM